MSTSELEESSRDIKYEVECLLDYDDCLMAMRVYTLNGDLPLTLNEEVTGLLNRLLYTSYNSRSTFWMTELVQFLHKYCRVPHYKINIT